MLWILVPLWLSWFFGEFFQEKLGTSFGNAISNAVIVLWAGIDCIRQTLFLIDVGEIHSDVVLRFVLCGVLLAYGILIIVYGTKTKEKVKRFGRIRDVTYAFAIFVPVLYNAVSLTWNHFIAAIIFFPIFHYAIELIDIKAPTPKALKSDLNQSETQVSSVLQKKPLEQSSEIKQTENVRNTNNNSERNQKPPSKIVNYWND